MYEEFINEMVELCKPDKVTIITDSQQDIEYIRRRALEEEEEFPLEKWGHTYHYDDPDDQQLIKPATGDISDVRDDFSNVMTGKEMFVCFYSVGPVGSHFSIPAVQVTDSAYAAHSGMLLYRHYMNEKGGEEDKEKGRENEDFIAILHSKGKTKGKIKEEKDGKDGKRFACIDPSSQRVYIYGSQYIENSVGLYRHATALIKQKAQRENWLAEDMIIMGLNGPLGGEKVYLAGAFEEAEKIPTALSQNATILGSGQALLKAVNGQLRATISEQGIFGITPDVSIHKAQILFDAITTPREVIVSNIGLDDKNPLENTLWFWVRVGDKTPPSGINYFAKWHEGVFDRPGNEAKRTPRNADYCMKVEELSSADPKLHDPEGVKIDGIIYGKNGKWGKSANSDKCGKCSVPIVEVLGWDQFKKELDVAPKVFEVNFTHNLERAIWLQWARGRILGRLDAIKMPIGFIPIYEDLQMLYDYMLDQHYERDTYDSEFMIK